jgi:hypothetical protein
MEDREDSRVEAKVNFVEEEEDATTTTYSLLDNECNGDNNIGFLMGASGTKAVAEDGSGERENVPSGVLREEAEAGCSITSTCSLRPYLR